jgi:hypothetical protein
VATMRYYICKNKKCGLYLKMTGLFEFMPDTFRHISCVKCGKMMELDS